MAASIKKETGLEPELMVGGRGEFTVWLGDTLVAQKGPLGFPTDDEVLAAVRRGSTE